MKQVRIVALLLSAILLLSLLAGCAGDPVATEASALATKETPPLTEPQETVPETTEPDVPARWQNGGKMSFLPQEALTIPNLSEMPYSRPDTESLFAAYDALTAKAADCSDAEALLADYYALLPDRQSFDTMYGIAYYQYCMDTNIDYYYDEYDFCDEQSPLLEEKESALFAAFAASPCRDALEQAYFGAGFFEDYDDFQVGGEEYLRLKAQENTLLDQYYETAASWDFDRNKLTQYHDTVAPLFVELVKVRQQIAAAKGYESFSDYAYADIFHRDYTTAQTQDYLYQVREKLVPLVKSMYAHNPTLLNASYPFIKSADTAGQLSAAAEQLGGPIWEAFRFMEGHQLYDNSDSSSKYPTSYSTYLPSYEAPIVFVSDGDFCTLSHEFGHFVNFYCTYGDFIGQDIDEIYSQAMVFLVTAYNPAFNEEQQARALRVALRDLLERNIIRQAAFADFELQVYALEPDEITVDRIDTIYAQCAKDYYFDDYSLNKMHWSEITHFFLYPSYVISYSTSAVAAMQVCRLEAEQPGDGVDAFCRLLNRTHHRKFSFVLNEAGLDSPFEEATMQKTADFLKSFLELP